MKIRQIPRLKTMLIAAAVSTLLFGLGFQAAAEEDYSSIPGMPKLEIMTGNDRWGCEVLLCLANPNGPKAVSECKPPINKLFDCLSWRHPCKFPKCPMAGDGNYAKQTSSAFDPCSQTGPGLTEAPKGYIVEGLFSDSNKFETRRGKRYLKKRLSRYNYDGDHYFKATEYSDAEWGGSRACVAQPQGQAYEPYTCTENDYPTTCYRTVNVYGKDVWQEEKSRRSIDVFIDGRLSQRVHW